MNRHIQVIGFSRTGTTLLMMLLQACLKDFEVASGEKTLSRALRGNKNTVGKRPLDMLNFDAMKQIGRDSIKDVGFILMQRDIRDVITSVHHNIPNDYFIGYDICYHVYGYNNGTKIEPGIGQLLRGYNLFKNDARTYIIRYEDLVSTPLKVQEALSTHCRLRWKHKFNDIRGVQVNKFYKDSNAVRPISSTEVSRWRRPEHRERIKEQFTNFPQLFDILIDDGYEEDNSWFDKYKI